MELKNANMMDSSNILKLSNNNLNNFNSTTYNESRMDKSNITELKGVNMIENLRHKRNLSQNVNTLSNNNFVKNNGLVKYKEQYNENKNVNTNITYFKNELNQYNSKSDNLILANSLSPSILIEDNISLLNQKLRGAMEYYNQNKNIDLYKTKIDNKNEDLNKKSICASDSKNHVSKYIKRFLNQAHEDKELQSDQFFNMQNCKINSRSKDNILIDR